MNFLKQLLFFLVLVCPITCMPATMPGMPFPISDDRKQDIFSILKVIGKAVESELAFINVDVNQDEIGLINIDQVQAEQFFQQKLPVIVTKVSNAVKHTLTKNQQTIVINLLHNLQSLSSFTKDDFVKMTKVDWEHMEDDNKYIPEELNEKFKELAKKMDNRHKMGNRYIDFSLEEFILMRKELGKIDFHDESFNLLIRFMNLIIYVWDLGLMAKIDLGSDKAALPLQKCCEYLGRVIRCVVKADCFSPGCQCMRYSWEKAFEKIANIFCVVNRLSSALLKSIENQ